jgi:hypothetical protein
MVSEMSVHHGGEDGQFTSEGTGERERSTRTTSSGFQILKFPKPPKIAPTPEVLWGYFLFKPYHA